jgi:hypothetical protein
LIVTTPTIGGKRSETLVALLTHWALAQVNLTPLGQPFGFVQDDFVVLAWVLPAYRTTYDGDFGKTLLEPKASPNRGIVASRTRVGTPARIARRCFRD